MQDRDVLEGERWLVCWHIYSVLLYAFMRQRGDGHGYSGTRAIDMVGCLKRILTEIFTRLPLLGVTWNMH